MSTGAARLLAPAILVLLAAGIVSAAVVGGDDDVDAAPATTTTAPDGDEGIPTTATSRPTTTTTTSTSTTRSTSDTTSTTAAGGTPTTAPAGTATTRPPGTTAPPPTAPPPTAPPATAGQDADLILHTNKVGTAIRFSIENAGPGSAPGITLTLVGVPGSVSPGSGVSCSGSGTLTCRVSTAGTGGIIGFVDVPIDAGCPSVSASVSSSVTDPNPGDNARSRTLC